MANTNPTCTAEEAELLLQKLSVKALREKAPRTTNLMFVELRKSTLFKLERSKRQKYVDEQ